MRTKARLFGHPIHQMLIVFPLGLLGMAVIFDLIRLSTQSVGLSLSSYYMIAAGVISGLIAAVFGFIDWTSIPPGTRAKSIANWHARGNVVVLLLFAVSWYVRRPDPADPTMLAVALGLAGLVLAMITGWLGGELVDRLAVGVDEGAHVDAPSSLSGRPAHEGRRPATRPA